MLGKKSTAFVKLNKQGSVLNVSREHYLRQDIHCGISSCQACTSGSAVGLKLLDAGPDRPLLGSNVVYILDTNIWLHQLDLLEKLFLQHKNLTFNVILLETVAQEIKHNSPEKYQKVKTWLSPSHAYSVTMFGNCHHKETYIEKNDGAARQSSSTPSKVLTSKGPTDDTRESDNDLNDRLIRTATLWYSKHLPSLDIVFISDDVENRHRLQEQLLMKTTNVLVYSMKGWLEQLPQPDQKSFLVDMLHTPFSELSPLIPALSYSYPPHLQTAAVEDGLSRHVYQKGQLIINPYNMWEGRVVCRLKDGKNVTVWIHGRKALNRAVHGDTVVLKILKEELWSCQSDELLLIDDSVDGNAEMDVDIVSDDCNTGIELDSRKLFVKDADTVASPVKRISGVVLSIFNRSITKYYCGSLVRNISDNVFKFLPIDTKIPPILVRYTPPDDVADFLNARYLVAIDDWPAGSMLPLGHIVRLIGKPIGLPEVETECLLLEREISYFRDDWPSDVVAALPTESWQLEDHHMHDRWDLRESTPEICSIDPPGCTDIDDALHAKVISMNGSSGIPGTINDEMIFEVGVHIADVTHFVQANSTLDSIAAARGTTVYLSDRRIDMLPEILGSNLCSLRSNVDRLAFSVIWKVALRLDESGTSKMVILEESFSKSVIQSRASLTYQAAQSVLDLIVSNKLTPRDKVVSSKSIFSSILRIRQANVKWPLPLNLVESIFILNELAKLRKAERMQNGALTLSSPEIRFNRTTHCPDVTASSATDILSLECKDMLESNSLVEEFMLLANVTVASKIYSVYPDLSILRRHPSPPENNFQDLETQLCLKFGRSKVLDWSSSKNLAQSLDDLEASLAKHHDASGLDQEFNVLVRMLVTRCMMQAVYFCSSSLPYPAFHHYGLSCPIYTHFTSPIRRYADVLVHRLLYAAISGGGAPWSSCSKKQLEQVVKVLNRRHRMAQYAGRDSVDFYLAVYVDQLKNCGSIEVNKAAEDLPSAITPSKTNEEEQFAYVINVYANGLLLFLPSLGIETPILFNGDYLAKASILFDPKTLSFSVGASRRIVSVFDKVKVTVITRMTTRSKMKRVALEWINMPAVLAPALLTKKRKHEEAS